MDGLEAAPPCATVASCTRSCREVIMQAIKNSCDDHDDNHPSTPKPKSKEDDEAEMLSIAKSSKPIPGCKKTLKDLRYFVAFPSMGGRVEDVQ